MLWWLGALVCVCWCVVGVVVGSSCCGFGIEAGCLSGLIGGGKVGLWEVWYVGWWRSVGVVDGGVGMMVSIEGYEIGFGVIL